MAWGDRELAAGTQDTFQITNGVHSGANLTFNVLAPDSSCPQQWDQFFCTVNGNAMSCIDMDVHCHDQCAQNVRVTHTIKITYALTKQ